MRLPVTPSQTAGPYLSIGMDRPGGAFAVPEGTPRAVWIRGRLLDGTGDPVPDGMVETWGADPDGRFAGQGSSVPGFRGFGRSLTGPDGAFGILTLKPGRVVGADGTPGEQAPHLDVSVFARGMLKRAMTRIYFADEGLANATDPVLAAIDETRRATLLAQPVADGYRFDIRLQGDGETVFFRI